MSIAAVAVVGDRDEHGVVADVSTRDVSPGAGRPIRLACIALIAAWSAITLIGSSCSTADDAADDAAITDAAGAYAQVMTWIVTTNSNQAADDDRPVAYVEAQGPGMSIDLELQAEVVNETRDSIDLRFVDDADEAVIDGAIIDGGLLITLGPLVGDDDQVDVEASVTSTSELPADSIRFVLSHGADGWQISGTPELVVTT